MAEAQVGIVITAEERAVAALERTSKAVTRLDRTFGTLAGRLKVGLQWNYTYKAIRSIERAISGVVHAIPDLIKRGEEWANTVDDITDATGMSAAAASELAAVQSMLGNSTFRLAQAMVQFGRNVEMHPKLMKELGASIVVAKDGSVDAYSTFLNLRDAIAQMGASTQATKFATLLLGRGARDLLDLLLISPAAFRAYSAEARAMGLILTEAGLQALEQWKRTRAMLDLAVTGLGAQIAQAAAPALTALVSGITNAIQTNLAQIASFAAGVVGFIAGLISGLFGISLNAKITAAAIMNLNQTAGRAWSGTANAQDKAAKASDGAAKAIERQIDAIDRKLARMDRANEQRQAREEYRDLMKDLAEARKELNEVRDQSVFAASMSNAEAELARQAHARDVIDAQQRVRDAEERLDKWRRDQAAKRRREALEDRRNALQEQLAAIREGAAAQVAAQKAIGADLSDIVSRNGRNVNSITKQVAKEMATTMSKALEDSKAFGLQISNTIKDVFLGPETYPGLNQLGQPGGTPVRKGGPVQSFITGMVTLGEHLNNLSKLVGPGGSLVLGLAAVAAALKFVPGVPSPGPSGVMVAGILAGVLGQEAVNQEDRRDGPVYDVFKELNRIVGRDYDSDLTKRDAKHPGQGTNDYIGDIGDTIDWWREKLFPESNDKPKPTYVRPHAGPGMYPPKPPGASPGSVTDNTWAPGSVNVSSWLLGNTSPGSTRRPATPSSNRKEGVVFSNLWRPKPNPGAAPGSVTDNSWAPGSVNISPWLLAGGGARRPTAGRLSSAGGGLGMIGMGGLGAVQSFVGAAQGGAQLASSVTTAFTPLYRRFMDMSSPIGTLLGDSLGTLTQSWMAGEETASNTAKLETGVNVTSVPGTTVVVSGDVGLLSSGNRVTVGNTVIPVSGDVGILSSANTVRVGNTVIPVNGNVGLLSTANTVSVGNPTLNVGGTVGLLSTSNTVNVGQPTVTLGAGARVGLVTTENTIKLGSVDGGVTIQVGGSVSLTDAIVNLLQATVVNTGWIRDRMNGLAAYYGATGLKVEAGTVQVDPINPTQPVRLVGSTITLGTNEQGVIPIRGSGNSIPIWTPNQILTNEQGVVPIRGSGTNIPVGVQNKPAVEVGRWDPWSSGMYVFAAQTAGRLERIMNEGLRTSYATFAEGTPYVPSTGMALIHRGEMVVPANLAQAIRDDGATLSGSGARGGGGGGDRRVNLTINIDGRAIARAMGIYLGPGTSSINVNA